MQQTSVQKTKKNKKKIGGMNMFKKMKHIKNEKGLTLIELLAVIVILAIIAAIAIPAIGNIINNQRDKAILSDVSGAISAAKIAYAEGTCTAGATDPKTACDLDDIAFESGKIDAIVVSFNNAGVATVTDLTFESGTSFNGKKASDYEDVIEKADGTTGGFTEAELNTLMGN